MKQSYLSLIKESQEEIIEKWIDEVEKNPSFQDHSLAENPNLKALSGEFLSKIIHTLEKNVVPTISKDAFGPIIKIWHSLLHEQIQKGLSTKDTAILIYTLKTSILSLFEEKKNDSFFAQLSNSQQLEHLLDLLGILTFEIYSIEKEKLITRQSNQIQYLQQSTLKFKTDFVGTSPKITAVFKAIGLVLENDITVLLEGESGTGKDLIARLIHYNSKQKEAPIVTVNCGAIPNDLLESELFGHEKGAFTGAEEQKIGKFELAHGGTLFLDEISELPLDLQVKLLRAIQNKEIERVGGTTSIKLNTRIIAATNKNLKTLVDESKFRLDLYYRINVFPITVPSLRERKEDIIPLCHYFIKKYSQKFNIPAPNLTMDAEQFLYNHAWPGNIRELENLIQRTLILSQGQPISSLLLELKPGEFAPPKLLMEPPSLSKDIHCPIESLDEVEKKAIINALAVKKNNILQVAKALKISRTTLYSKIEKYNIQL